MTYMGVQSLINLLSHIFFVCVTFWALQALRTDTWIKKYHVSQARLLYVLVAIAIGYMVSNFFLDIITYSQNMIHLFGSTFLM